MTTPVSTSTSSSVSSACTAGSSTCASSKSPRTDGDLALSASPAECTDSYEASSSNYGEVLGQVPPNAANNNSSAPTVPLHQLQRQEELRASASAPKDCVNYVPHSQVPGVWSPVGRPDVMTDSPTDACPTGPRPTLPSDSTETPEAPVNDSSKPASESPASPTTPNVTSIEPSADADSGFVAEVIKNEVAELDSPGDSVKVGGSAFAKVELGGKVGGEMQIERTEDGYTLSMGGEAAAIFAPEVGGAAGLKADVGVEFSAGGVAKTELSFSSKEELNSFIDSVASFDPASSSSRTALVNEFGSHISAVEVGGKLTGAAVAELGGGRSFGGDITGGTEYQGVLRTEFENGQATSMGVRVDLKPVDLGAGAGALKLGEGNSVGIGGASANIGAEVQTTLELRLKRDPQSDQFVPDSQATLTVAGDVNGQVGKLGGSLHGEFQVDLDTARTRELLSQVARSDDGGAAALDYIRAAGELPQVTVKGYAYDTEGLNLSPEIKAYGVGVGGELDIERKDVGRIRQFEMTPTDALDWMID